jgi:glyoxylase-like metal-dependent hydrolase (beta-lactamase superfamily II)
MAEAIPFVSDDGVTYGEAVSVSPLIRRLVANNPGPFTYTGTGTYIVGGDVVAVIDPGPDDPVHVSALVRAVSGLKVSHIVITHTHRDHSPASRALKAATGAPIVGCAPILANDDGPKVEEAFDADYAPDQVLVDGETISGPGWTLQAVHTPGHTSNHLCYALLEEKALFTGDHIMGWSTTVIAPPDGDMSAYFASLRKVLERDDATLWPTHGKPVTNPKPFVRALITHRKMREGQILDTLKAGPSAIPAMVERLYASVPKVLHPAAGRSVLAHLIDLERQGRVRRDGEGREALYLLA